jgi:hypothetical protein
VRLRNRKLALGLQPVDLAQQRTFAQLELGLFKLRPGLLQFGSAPLIITSVLCLALLHLVLQIFVAGLSIPRLIHQPRAIKLRDYIS